MIKLFLLLFFMVTEVYSDDTIKHLKLMQLNLDKNQLEQVEEIYDDNEELLKYSWMALERLAISFERREKLKEAIDVYRKIIISFNKSAHDKILKTPKESITEDFYKATKLSLYYYKIAFLNTQLYINSHNFTSLLDRSKYKKNAEGFITLVRKINGDEGELKLLEDQLIEKIELNKKKIYSASWYVTADIMSWQDSIFLVEKSTNEKSKLLSTAFGSCFGGGRKWQNVNYEFNFEGCFVVGNATISSQNLGINYEQSSVSEKGLMGGPGFYIRSFSESVLIGLQIPFLYRTGDWTAPTADYSFDYKKLGAGYFLQSKFIVGDFFFRTRIGRIFPNPSSHWSLGLVYNF